MTTDEEQVENLKRWWKDNGASVIAGIVIGVGSLIGYQYWTHYQESNAVQASSHFMQMVEAIESDNLETVSEQANLLISDYASSEYATMAHLALAKGFVEAGDYEKAQHQLQQVIGNAGNSPLGFIARKRLAAVQLQMGQIDQALTTLSIEFPAQFAAVVEELKGDLYASQGKKTDAVNAYRKAQQGNPGPASAELLQQKIDDLGLGIS